MLETGKDPQFVDVWDELKRLLNDDRMPKVRRVETASEERYVHDFRLYAIPDCIFRGDIFVFFGTI